MTAPDPLRMRDGAYVTEIAAPELAASRRCAVFRWVEGEPVDEPRPHHLTRLGAMTAELHNHADTYAPDTPVERPRANWPGTFARFVRGDISATWGGPRLDVATEEERRVFMDAAALLTETTSAHPNDRDYGLIHADLHQWNVLYHDGEPRPIDFDDCQFAPYMQDVATTLWYLVEDDDYPTLRDAYLAGYRARRDMPADWIEQVDVFMAARYLSMLGWILIWPKEDHIGSGAAAVSLYARRLSEYLNANA